MTMHNISSWKEMTRIQLNWIIIRLEARLRPSIGFILRGDSAVLTRSAITPPKVNRFGWNLKHSEYIVGRLDFGRDPLSSDSLRGSRFFCLVNNARFRQFPGSQISRRPNLTKFKHNNVDRCRDENVRNRILKILPQGVVFPKSAKIPQQISRSCDIWPP